MHQIFIKFTPCTCTLCFICAWISGQKQNNPHCTPSLLTRFGNKWLPFSPKTQDIVNRKKFNDITKMQSKSQDQFAQFKYRTSQNTSTVAQFQSSLFKAPRRLMKGTILIRRYVLLESYIFSMKRFNGTMHRVTGQLFEWQVYEKCHHISLRTCTHTISTSN